jgi:hypothetical protein
MGALEFFAEVFVSAIKGPFSIFSGIVLFLTIIANVLINFLPQWENSVKYWMISIIPLSVFLMLFLIGLFVSCYQIYYQNYTEQNDKIISLTKDLDSAKAAAIPNINQLMMQPYFKDTVIPIAGIITSYTEPVLRNKTFERCTIIGPAIFVLQHFVTMSHCSFEGDPESMFIVTTNKRVWGVIALDHDTFISCNFKKVAFIGPQELIDSIKKGFVQHTQ